MIASQRLTTGSENVDSVKAEGLSVIEDKEEGISAIYGEQCCLLLAEDYLGKEKTNNEEVTRSKMMGEREDFKYSEGDVSDA